MTATARWRALRSSSERPWASRTSCGMRGALTICSGICTRWGATSHTYRVDARTESSDGRRGRSVGPSHDGSASCPNTTEGGTWTPVDNRLCGDRQLPQRRGDIPRDQGGHSVAPRLCHRRRRLPGGASSRRHSRKQPCPVDVAWDESHRLRRPWPCCDVSPANGTCSSGSAALSGCWSGPLHPSPVLPSSGSGLAAARYRLSRTCRGAPGP